MDFHPEVQGLEELSNQEHLWVNLEKPTRNKMDILSRGFSIHELNIEDCLTKNQLPKIDRYDDHIFVILQFPTIQKERSAPTLSQLSLFIGKNYLLTVSHGDLRPLTELFQNCKFDSNGYKQNMMGNSTGYLLHTILDILVDDLLHILMKVIGNLDDIEDDVFDDKIAVSKEIAFLRREITTLRRIVLPLKRIVSELISRDIKKFSAGLEDEEDLINYFDNINDHIAKVLEVLDESKETIEIYKDTDHMLSTEKTNKILSFLTILFSLSIPITVVGTFYGMNIVIPGSVNQIKDLTSYIPLIGTLGGSIVSTGVMFYYFRKFGWVKF